MVSVDKRDTRLRRRFFLKLNTAHKQSEPFSLAESCMLASLNNKSELSFAELKNYIKHYFSHDSDAFKYKYVLPDLKKKGFFTLPNVLSRKGRREKNYLERKLENINTNIELLIQNKTLESELITIGLNVILLNKDVITKIKGFKSDVLQLDVIAQLSNNKSLDNLHALTSLASFDMINSFDFSDASTDFGNGDFGGAGGGGGDW